MRPIVRCGVGLDRQSRSHWRMLWIPSASVPGGPYEVEHWAVAVYEGGRTEQLAPANPVPSSESKPSPAANSAAR